MKSKILDFPSAFYTPTDLVVTAWQSDYSLAQSAMSCLYCYSKRLYRTKGYAPHMIRLSRFTTSHNLRMERVRPRRLVLQTNRYPDRVTYSWI